MTRKSKQSKRRAISPRKRHYPLFEKTGPKKDALESGYKPCSNALTASKTMYIAKISH